MSKVVSFAVNGDTKVEANETFRVSLSGATNGATIGDNLGVATIATTIAPTRTSAAMVAATCSGVTTMARSRCGR